MNRKSVGIVLFLALVSVTALSAQAKNWYVDNSVGASGNGQSWSTAWKNLSDIVWTSVAAGDTLYVSGGSTSKKYNETLTIGKSGSVGNNITVRNGVDSSHSGTVILDGGNTRNACIDVLARLNVVVSGFYCQNGKDWGVRVIDGSSNVTIQYCTMTACGQGSDNTSGGIILRGDALVVDHCKIINVRGDAVNGIIINSTISNNTIYDDSGQALVVDGIDVGGSNILIDQNIIHGLENVTQHGDAIVIEPSSQYNSNGIIIRFNTTYDNLQHIYIDSYYYGAGSTGIANVEIYYNLIYKTSLRTADVHGIPCQSDDGGTSPITNLKIYNNTIVASAATTNVNDQGISTGGNSITNMIVENNVFYNMSVAVPNTVNMDFNLYYATTGRSLIIWGGTEYSTLAAFKSVVPSREIHGISANPAFINVNVNDLLLTASSPAINIGKNVGLSRDIMNNVVPTGGGIDMGAFEYQSVTDTIQQPKNLRIKQ